MDLNHARLPIPPYLLIKLKIENGKWKVENDCVNFCIINLNSLDLNSLDFYTVGKPRRSLLSDKSYFSADSATALKMCYIIIADRQVSVK